MRLTFTFLLATLLLSCVSCSSNKIGYINPAKLMQQYHGATAKQAEFQSKLRDWQARVDSLRTEQAPTSQIDQYQAALQQRVATENQRLIQQVLEEVNAYMKEYGKQHGYYLILGATEQGNLVYAAEGADITDEVILGLNTKYDAQHDAPGK